MVDEQRLCGRMGSPLDAIQNGTLGKVLYEPRPIEDLFAELVGFIKSN